MKDSLLEILMNFFEKTLAQLKESEAVEQYSLNTPVKDSSIADINDQALTIKAAQDTAFRIFIDEEQKKFSKASHQFLTRMLMWGIIAPEALELIINQLLFSESRFVTLQETKWTIRKALAENLDTAQLAFLDLVLYQKEDQLTMH